MADNLTRKQELIYLKSLVNSGIIQCKHEIEYDDFCLICKKEINNKTKD